MNEVSNGPIQKPIATAQWMDPDIAAERFPYADGRFWIGRDPVDPERALGVDDDRHVLLVAGTRSGKGRALIVNNLTKWPGSIVAIDPKGENAMVAARRRGAGSAHCDGLGQEVHVLDPFGATQRADLAGLYSYYNPLEELDPADRALPRKVARIAESLFMNVNKNDPTWEKKGGQMLETLILHVVTSPDFDEDERNLVTVRKLLLAGDLDGYRYLKEQCGIDDPPPPAVLMWQAVIDNPSCEGIIAHQGESYLNSLENNVRYYDSVKTSAEDATKWIDDLDIRRVLQRPGEGHRTFRLGDLKDHPKGLSIFLSLPSDDREAYARWQRMMIDLMVGAMRKSQSLPRNGYRVLFCLDEFTGLGKMDKIRNAAAEIAGAGVKLFIAVQGLNQLEEVYDKGWETFIGNSGLQLYFSIQDNFTLDYLSKALGETEVVRVTRSANVSETQQVTKGTTAGGSRGGGTAETSGGQTSWQKSKGGQDNWQTTQTRQSGWQKGHGHQEGWNRGRSGGAGRSGQSGWNTSAGAHYHPGIFFQGRQSGSNAGRGQSGGQGWNTSAGWTSGASGGRQSNYSRSAGTSTAKAQGGGTSWQDSHGGGENWSNQVSENWQDTWSTQESEARGSQRGQGAQETLHKKPLLTFDEIQTWFRRIDDPAHDAYPGLILVRIAGEDPVLARRAHYDQDPVFQRCFDPHPDYLELFLRRQDDLRRLQEREAQERARAEQREAERRAHVERLATLGLTEHEDILWRRADDAETRFSRPFYSFTRDALVAVQYRRTRNTCPDSTNELQIVAIDKHGHISPLTSPIHYPLHAISRTSNIRTTNLPEGLSLDETVYSYDNRLISLEHDTVSEPIIIPSIFDKGDTVRAFSRDFSRIHTAIANSNKGFIRHTSDGSIIASVGTSVGYAFGSAFTSDGALITCTAALRDKLGFARYDIVNGFFGPKWGAKWHTGTEGKGSFEARVEYDANTDLVLAVNKGHVAVLRARFGALLLDLPFRYYIATDSVVMDSNGAFVLLCRKFWDEDGTIRIERYNIDGHIQWTCPIPVDGYEGVTITLSPSGRFAVLQREYPISYYDKTGDTIILDVENGHLLHHWKDRRKPFFTKNDTLLFWKEQDSLTRFHITM